MTMEKMGCVIECWPIAADENGIWLVSGVDAWRSPPIPADSEPHFELELLVASQGESQPRLVHSTSWRPDGPVVVLTYVAVLDSPDLVVKLWPDAAPIPTDLLATVGNPLAHDPSGAPVPRYIDVLMHALRHCRFLLDTDATARAALTGHWVTWLEQMRPALAGMYEVGVEPVDI